MYKATGQIYRTQYAQAIALLLGFQFIATRPNDDYIKFWPLFLAYFVPAVSSALNTRLSKTYVLVTSGNYITYLIIRWIEIINRLLFAIDGNKGRTYAYPCAETIVVTTAKTYFLKKLAQVNACAYLCKQTLAFSGRQTRYLPSLKNS